MGMEKIKNFFKEENASKFFCSKEFVALWLVVVFICWITGGWIAGFIIAAILAGLILCLCRDTLPVITILWTFLFMLGVNRHKLQGAAPLISAVVVVVAGVIVNLIRFRPKFRFLNYKTVTATTVGILAFCAAIVLSGIARGERYLNFSEHGLYATVVGLLGVLLALGYIFFSATISGGEDGKRVLNHLMFVMFASSVLITLQIIVRYAQSGGMQAVIDGIKTKNTDLGWGGPNNYSIILGMMMPASVYYAVKHGKYSPLFIIYSVLQFMLILLSASRGAVLFGGLFLVIALGYAVVKSEYRGRMVVTLIAIIDVGIIVFMAYAKEINEIFARMMSLGLDSNGRAGEGQLWADAITNFKANPIFGTGFDYHLGYHVPEAARDGYTPYWYHSTFFQALASMGIVGFLAWVNLEASRLRAFVTDVSPEKIFMLFAYGIFWGYGLVDVFYFTPNGLLFLFMITLAIEKSVETARLRSITVKFLDRKFTERAILKAKKND